MGFIMFADIYSLTPSDLTGSLQKKDENGIQHTATFDIAPCGDLMDNDGWVEKAKAGGSLSDNGKDENGCTRKRNLKEATSRQMRMASEVLLGLKTPDDIREEVAEEQEEKERIKEEKAKADREAKEKAKAAKAKEKAKRTGKADVVTPEANGVHTG